jgi:hypothetical protein
MFTHYYFEAYLGRDPFGIGAMDVKAYWAGKNQCAWSQTSKSRLPAWLSEGLKEHTHRADEDAARQATIFMRMRHDVR